MKNFKNSIYLIAVCLLAITSCNKDNNSIDTSGLNLNISGLSDLGSNFKYEGWIIVNGTPVSTGTFSVDSNGKMSKNSFDVSNDNLLKSSKFVLTIEPSPDNDPKPSATHILAGDISSKKATLSIDNAAALGNNFASATGKYILATPTDGNNDMNEHSGVWWLDNSGDSPKAGLSLPTLPKGWNYEGWVVIDGKPISTGTFTSVSGMDSSAIFSDTVAAGPAYPGEDLLKNAPSGLTFPVHIHNQKVVISIEPSPDNSDKPFLLKPLVASVPATGIQKTETMVNNAAKTNPTGTVSF